MNKFFKQKNNKNSGFTLVETLIAISIFSVSILAMMSILASSISSTSYSKTKVIASYLAQEGVEYMRNLRDTYALYDGGGGQAGWDAFKNKISAGGCNGVNGCFINADLLNYSDNSQPIIDITLTACSSNCTNGVLNYDSATGKYGFSSGIASNFTRQINTELINTNQVKITSTVFFKNPSGNYNASFSQDVFNWIE